jgi:NADPH:quinone reductase-like Zn-dependent oxidoreductase
MRAYEILAGSSTLDGLRRCERPDPVGAAGSPYGLLAKQASLHGVYVGCRSHFERMNTAIAAHRLEPIIDREFGFEDAPAAYRHLESGAHFGKVVIRL